MIYYLNSFCPIVKTKYGYEFPENHVTYEIEVNQKDIVFTKLLGKEGVEEEKLIEELGTERFQEWVDKKILLTMQIDEEGIYSRSMSYYYHKALGNAPYILSKKKVLILGCGGIGSHIAWNLSVLGVGTLYLVDYDKVEISNLNRQILYDTSDVGQDKVAVLKEKISKINPYIQIETIHMRIDSKEKLSEIVMRCSPDIIVKSLDSPLYFPKWLDEVCYEKKVKYVSGILSGTKQMIGPTYIPDRTAGYAEFFDLDDSKERIAGIGPSLGFVMYQLSGKLTEEIFKLLVGKGELLYKNRIELYDNLTNERSVLYPRHRKNEEQKGDFKVHNIQNLLVIVCIYFIGMACSIPQYLIILLAGLYTIVMPIILSNTKHEVFSYAFTNLLYMVMCNLLISFTGGAFSILNRSIILGFISLVYTIMGVFVLVLAIIELLLFRLKLNWRSRRREDSD